ncbi:hypothetical protein F0562_003911 [Nyssa sinensis]|uniref:Uncharacterized protein n=1 Tax=Nyssa sinensis TaxID=561372 RepID=A0A5J5BW18_9ASTE|nr:hypothetical protein F0562_003911 [Nyssa sinensis]
MGQKEDFPEWVMDSVVVNDLAPPKRDGSLGFVSTVGSFSPTIIPFIDRTKTSEEAWLILANTYAKPSRGCIKHIKNQIKNLTKGSQSVTEFLQSVKCRVDELAILGAPMDEDDLIDKILDGLGDDYKELIHAVQARDTMIMFNELHEKLLNFEASFQGAKSEPSHFPASANPANHNTTSWHPSSNSGKHQQQSASINQLCSQKYRLVFLTQYQQSLPPCFLTLAQTHLAATDLLLDLILDIAKSVEYKDTLPRDVPPFVWCHFNPIPLQLPQ